MARMKVKEHGKYVSFDSSESAARAAAKKAAKRKKTSSAAVAAKPKTKQTPTAATAKPKTKRTKQTKRTLTHKRVAAATATRRDGGRLYTIRHALGRRADLPLFAPAYDANGHPSCMSSSDDDRELLRYTFPKQLGGGHLFPHLRLVKNAGEHARFPHSCRSSGPRGWSNPRSAAKKEFLADTLLAGATEDIWAANTDYANWLTQNSARFLKPRKAKAATGKKKTKKSTTKPKTRKPRAVAVDPLDIQMWNDDDALADLVPTVSSAVNLPPFPSLGSRLSAHTSPTRAVNPPPFPSLGSRLRRPARRAAVPVRKSSAAAKKKKPSSPAAAPSRSRRGASHPNYAQLNRRGFD